MARVTAVGAGSAIPAGDAMAGMWIAGAPDDLTLDVPRSRLTGLGGFTLFG